ncbi:MAG: 50S ribosomal protein L23 [Patescibacteria group bacterium]
MSLLNLFKDKDKKERKRYAERAKSKIIPAEETVVLEKKAKADSGRLLIKDGRRAVGVIRAPHITEKATYLSESLPRGENAGGHYVFTVNDDANKQMVKQAVEGIYGVSVEKVRILAKRQKPRLKRGVHGYKSGSKKAIVILKRGDRIEFV